MLPTLLWLMASGVSIIPILSRGKQSSKPSLRTTKRSYFLALAPNTDPGRVGAP